SRRSRLARNHHTLLRERRTQQVNKQQSWMRDTDAAGVASVFERNRANNRDRVLTEAAMNRDLASRAFGRRHDFIDDRQEGIGWTSCDECRLADCRSGFDKEIERVVVDGQ